MVVVVKDSKNADRKCNTTSEIMSQNFVGNCKEYRVRVNENSKTLKIVGNNNKITVDENYGHLDIVGNMNKIKVLKNCGKISYIGNGGKVYLGRGSTAKEVDYTGNNGVLKFFNEVDFEGGNHVRTSVKSSWDSKSTSSSSSLNESDWESNKTPFVADDPKQNDEKPSKHFHKKTSSKNNKKDNVAYISVHNNISLPNLNALSAQNIRIHNSISFSGSTGNIVVNNFYSA